jgi:hypothetical protein
VVETAPALPGWRYADSGDRRIFNDAEELAAAPGTWYASPDKAEAAAAKKLKDK